MPNSLDNAFAQLERQLSSPRYGSASPRPLAPLRLGVPERIFQRSSLYAHERSLSPRYRSEPSPRSYEESRNDSLLGSPVWMEQSPASNERAQPLFSWHSHPERRNEEVSTSPTICAVPCSTASFAMRTQWLKNAVDCAIPNTPHSEHTINHTIKRAIKQKLGVPDTDGSPRVSEYRPDPPPLWAQPLRTEYPSHAHLHRTPCTHVPPAHARHTCARYATHTAPRTLCHVLHAHPARHARHERDATSLQRRVRRSWRVAEECEPRPPTGLTTVIVFMIVMTMYVITVL